MTDTAIALSATQAGVATLQQVNADGALFQPGDVGRALSIRCTCPVRVASTAYAVGAVFYADYALTDRVYRVTGSGTTASSGASGTTPPYDVNAPRLATDGIVDGSCLLKYLGAGQQAYGFGIITQVLSSTAVMVQVDPRGPFASTSPSQRWRLGEWSAARGYPAAVTFFQQRTYWGGTPTKPDTIWTSQSGDFENMSSGEPDGVVLDTNAVTLALDDDQVNSIQWMQGIPRGLAVGVASGEFLVGPASTVNSAISPTNIRAVRQGNRGSPNIAGIRIGGVVLFVQRSGRKLRELEYDFATDSFLTEDLSQLAEHLSGPGFVEMAYQDEPDGVMWLVRADGLLISLTFDREQKVRAWCQHSLGGTGAAVESVCTVPAPDGSADEVYLAVARTIAGQLVRSIEVLRAPYRAAVDGINGGFFVDAGLTYSGAPATVFTGLDYLDGETVVICADGAVRPAQVVVGGSVSIAAPGAILVHIGLSYSSTLQTLPPEVAIGGGSSLGKVKRIGHVTLRLFETRGGLIGRDGGPAEPLQMRPQAAAMSQAEPLFTGDLRIMHPAGLDRSGMLVIGQDDPLPLTVLAIAFDVTVNT